MTPAARHQVAEAADRLPRNLMDEEICQRVFRDDQKIQQYYATHHSWSNPQGRGRLRVHDAHAQPQKPWRECAMCQRFFRSGAASGWFEVGRKLAGGGYTLKANGAIITHRPSHDVYSIDEVGVTL
ncbi:hypothetical protein QWA68_016982 [Fusarium oxysporum]|nr:hypothetical protein QWA68_016982 [Fusarium oxysporum]